MLEGGILNALRSLCTPNSPPREEDKKKKIELQPHIEKIETWLEKKIVSSILHNGAIATILRR